MERKQKAMKAMLIIAVVIVISLIWIFVHLKESRFIHGSTPVVAKITSVRDVPMGQALELKTKDPRFSGQVLTTRAFPWDKRKVGDSITVLIKVEFFPEVLILDFYYMRKLSTATLAGVVMMIVIVLLVTIKKSINTKES